VKIRKNAISSLICIVILLMIGAAASADTIRLKDGSILKGKVVSYNQGKFTIIIYIGGSSSQHIIGIDEIESVEFNSSDGAVPAQAESSSKGGGSVYTGIPPDPPSSRALPLDPPANSEGSKESTGSAPANDLPAEGDPVAIAEKTVSVAAAADWTSTEIRLQRGQRILISASGEVDLGNNRRCGPEGLNSTDNRKLIPNQPTGALIAVVGDDNDDFFYIGGSGEFTTTHNGILFLSVNEGNLKDNNGAFVARVKVLGNK
jgi:hypothetical protein